jgi:two-component system chemotaxis sensor kinase CheA
MSQDIDDEIREDFLVEAGELLAQLGGQLVALESRPGDRDLLNAVFRAFHTVKGGAGFLQLPGMVELCHAAEEIFGKVRDGRCVVDGRLMDVALQALDRLQEMMAQIAAGTAPSAAPAALIEGLRRAAVEPPSAAPAPQSIDDEFEALVDRFHQTAAAAVPAASAAAATGSIDDAEFEALLDQLHGGAVPGAQPPAAALTPPVAADSGARPVPGSAPPSAPAAAGGETSIRVDTQRLDQLMNLVGELVLVRNRLKTLHAASAPAEAYAKSVSALDQLTRALQAAVMQTRMQPIRKVFSRFPKLARDVARGLGKLVEVELVGEDTDLDKNLVEALADPLVHMVRNSVDHGIELPAQRVAQGKSPAGRLVLSAQQEGDHILIAVEDDGAGIDPERLRAKAVDKGLLTAAAAARLNAEECLQLVFMPGFSTKDQVSDLSGRGVGMDVVKSRITGLNGSVIIESTAGRGSCVKLRVPLTLAILPALMVSVGRRLLALPQGEVRDVFALDEALLTRLDPLPRIPYRGGQLRLVDLERWIGLESPIEDAVRHVVVAEVETECYGFIVHELRAREEIVVKPLGAGLRGLAGVAGATVTGEGRVALILDFPGLVHAWHSGRYG